MNTYTIINFIANAVMGYSMTMFYLYLYSDDNKVVHRWSFLGHWTLKLGMIINIVGILFNLLTFDKVNPSQLLVNCGFSLIFVWVYLFHRKMFNQKNQNEK